MMWVEREWSGRGLCFISWQFICAEHSLDGGHEEIRDSVALVVAALLAWPYNKTRLRNEDVTSLGPARKVFFRYSISPPSSNDIQGEASMSSQDLLNTSLPSKKPGRVSNPARSSLAYIVPEGLEYLD